MSKTGSITVTIEGSNSSTTLPLLGGTDRKSVV